MAQASAAEKPTIFITGASSGIGRGIAEYLSKSGKYKLALTARREDELKKTAELCKKVNPSIETLVLPCDARDESKFAAVIEKVGKEYGPLCCCIQNAGIYLQTEIDGKTGKSLGEINKCLDLNLKSVIHGCYHCVPFIKETRKKFGDKMTCAVIIIASDSSTFRMTFPEDSIYCATKFGVLGFAECLYHELQEYGIKVSSIMPGWVNTPMAENYNSDEVNKDNQLIIEHCLKVSDIGYTVEYVLNAPFTCVPLQILLQTQYPEYVNNIKDKSLLKNTKQSKQVKTDNSEKKSND